MDRAMDRVIDPAEGGHLSSKKRGAEETAGLPAGSSAERGAALRRLPSVDELVNSPGLAEIGARVDRALLVDAARAVLERQRAVITGAAARLATAAAPASDGGASGVEACAEADAVGADASAEAHALAEAVLREIAASLAPSLRPVINATGVILHTNLGRAPLSAAAIERIKETAGGYSNLEYDLETGARGRRDMHTAKLLTRLTGAEAAVAVNNNAAAVFLVLATLARGGEAIVSRGELIEIGESFRIPDIMAESGATLREVGTTNRTTLADYERAVTERTRVLLRVHRSNFQMVGFTARPSLGELVDLGRRTRVPVYEDLGSGCLADLAGVACATAGAGAGAGAGASRILGAADAGSAMTEPTVRESVAAGVDIVSFSGDKLLGGPQAGIIVGRGELVGRVRKHPLFRALRLDKLAIAALAATLEEHLRGGGERLPVFAMLRITAAEIGQRAAKLQETLRTQVAAREVNFEMVIVDGESVIGGGSAPSARLPTRLLQIASAQWSATELEARLRKPESGTPVLARIAHNQLVLDLRTVFPGQDALLAETVAEALRATPTTPKEPKGAT